jgi:nucleoside-diphosphate-sugar epimerase
MKTSTQIQTALVLGAAGGIGGEVARQLLASGWQVRALHRHPERVASQCPGLDWRTGDALDKDAVADAARGCSVIVHAVNPPGYRRWSELVLPMVDATIAAARAEHATVVLPGTVYNFGPDSLPAFDESSPQNPVTKKGAIRVELERRLREGTRDGAMRAIVVRAGDFFGPRTTGNSWFSAGLVTPGKPVRAITDPGRAGIGHQWAYLPDVAATMVRLVTQREQLDSFAVFHFRGHWDQDGEQMSATIRRVVEQSTGTRPKVRRFPWFVVVLGSPFVRLFREMSEMRYLWKQPVFMDNIRLCAAIGSEPHTPWDEAVSATLRGIGCLPA